MKATTSQLRAGSSAADHITIRRHNLSMVLSHLRVSGPRSRARVAEETGLNKATVSSLVAELVERGLLAEGETERGAVGRPGQSIELDGRRVCAIGAEVNIDFVSALALSLRGEVVAEKRIPLDTANLEPVTVLERLSELILEVISEVSSTGARTVGLCIAMPGLIESATGTVSFAPNLGWKSVAVVEKVRQLVGAPGYPVLLDNEANLAAIAEVNARGAAGKDLVLLTGAAGVGGGVVADGRLLRGGQGFAGEVGHMRLDPDGKQCGCGRRGCWETVVGLSALLARVADPEDPVRDPSLDVEQRLAELNRRAESGDERTVEAIAATRSWLAVGAGILVNIFNPEVLVLGGYFAALRPWLLDSFEPELTAQVFAPDAGGCRVEFSTLGFSAAVLGGAQSVLETVFRDPTLVDVPQTQDSGPLVGGMT